ncbi:MAG: mannose-1-phosphate guanylyltransferase [Anaerolineales bacterium]
MTLEHTIAVIMAGGGGTRLWPLSRTNRPKQSLAILEDRTLFQMAVERLAPAIPPDRILVVSVESMAGILLPQVPSLTADNFLNEPMPRGTASVIGYAATVLRRKDPNSVMACLTADHIIENEERFIELLGAAEKRALKGELVTLGIAPSAPSTGYGYIHLGDTLASEQGFEVRSVQQFKEKPDQVVAVEYVDSGEYAWNSGMFVWTADRILQEIERLMPDLHAALREIEQSIGTSQEAEVIGRVWEGLQSETVDYGIMERAEGVVVIPADDLGWWDVGGWDRLEDLLESDRSGNIIRAGEILLSDTKQTVIYQDRGFNRLIATLGLEDVVIVDTEDVILICDRKRAEEVRSLVARLSESGLEDYA